MGILVDILSLQRSFGCGLELRCLTLGFEEDFGGKEGGVLTVTFQEKGKTTSQLPIGGEPLR